MARDLLAPIPFREVFVILALFLPQLTFVDEATTRQELWSSPTVRKFGLVVDVTPTATFFPRVRTPCGHGAQVIIEGREIQSDGGEKDKDNPTTNQTKPTTAHRPRLHHQVVFPLY